jgi:prolyl-tRNA editing enzyme YbaK/EbsC (Cys-tRNA(Pro) deacylase)
MIGPSPKDRLLTYLDARGVPYRLLEHRECRSAAECTLARADAGDADSVGAKSLLVKSQAGAFHLLVLPAASRLARRPLRGRLKDFRFATDAELFELTGGLEYGMVPPVARPVFAGIDDLFVDTALLEAATIGFNAASLTESVVMALADYLRICDCDDIFSFGEDPSHCGPHAGAARLESMARA